MVPTPNQLVASFIGVLFSLNIWFVHRLITSIDASMEVTNRHVITIARIEEKLNSIDKSLETIVGRKYLRRTKAAEITIDEE